VQTSIKILCNAKISSKNLGHGRHTPCYDVLWCDFKRSKPTCHKFWFCTNDLNHYMGGTSRKYDSLIVLSLWFMQVRSNLNWHEVTTLEEARFLLCK
jgi:hypothetical protein